MSDVAQILKGATAAENKPKRQYKPRKKKAGKKQERMARPKGMSREVYALVSQTDAPPIVRDVYMGRAVP